MEVGQVAWFEIPASDLSRAKVFYGELFAWKFEEFGEDYFMAKGLNGAALGAVHLRKGAKPSGDTTVVTFNCKDAGVSFESAVRLGGQAVTPKTKISDEMGYFSLVFDSEGNKLGFWSQN
jgi:uncharacterized protein